VYPALMREIEQAWLGLGMAGLDPAPIRRGP
jgi:hypothetical protein